MLALISTLAYNYSVLLPLLTKEVFGRGGGSYGVLSAAMGAGALAGALLMASRTRPSRRLLVGAAFAFGVATIALALAPGYYAGLVFLVLIGGAGVLYFSTTNALLQLNAVDALRGRVMALWSIVFLGSTPIGGPIAGLLARGLGVRWALALGGVATLATAAGGLLALRRSSVVEEGTCEAGACCLPDGPAPGDARADAVVDGEAAADRREGVPAAAPAAAEGCRAADDARAARHAAAREAASTTQVGGRVADVGYGGPRLRGPLRRASRQTKGGRCFSRATCRSSVSPTSSSW